MQRLDILLIGFSVMTTSCFITLLGKLSIPAALEIKNFLMVSEQHFQFLVLNLCKICLLNLYQHGLGDAEVFLAMFCHISKDRSKNL